MSRYSRLQPVWAVHTANASLPVIKTASEALQEYRVTVLGNAADRNFEWVADTVHPQVPVVVFSPAASLEEQTNVYRLETQYGVVTIFTGTSENGVWSEMFRSSDVLLLLGDELELWHTAKVALQQGLYVGVVSERMQDIVRKELAGEAIPNVEKLYVDVNVTTLITKIQRLIS